MTPDLATKWSVSPDGKTYTFTLRHGVTFQDGTPFNAQSVVANVNYITAKTTQSTIALGLLGPCTTATAESQYTVELHCSTPYAPLLEQLGEPYMGIQSPTAIAKYGKNLGTHLVGTGPFKFVSYTPDQSVVLAAQPRLRLGAARGRDERAVQDLQDRLQHRHELPGPGRFPAERAVPAHPGNARHLLQEPRVLLFRAGRPDLGNGNFRADQRQHVPDERPGGAAGHPVLDQQDRR